MDKGKKQLKHLSLFSGVESFKMAMDNLGIENELVGFSEIDAHAITAMTAIHGVEESLNLGDIAKVDLNDVPSADLITYGFPCQDLSRSGHGKGIVQGKTRSGLLFEALEIIDHLQPKYAIAENVRQLVTTFKDDFENTMLASLEKSGYNNYWKILKASDYGSCQGRERAFVVSIRKDIDNGSFKFPEPVTKRKKFEDILEDESTIPEKYYYEKHRAQEFIDTCRRDGLPRDKRSLGNVFTNGVGLTGMVWIPYFDNIAPTITTAGPKIIVRNNSKGEKYRIRKFTPLEYWRLMGFSDQAFWKAKEALVDNYYPKGDHSDSQMYKMAGNAISVEVLEYLLEALLQK